MLSSPPTGTIPAPAMFFTSSTTTVPPLPHAWLCLEYFSKLFTMTKTCYKWLCMFLIARFIWAELLDIGFYSQVAICHCKAWEGSGNASLCGYTNSTWARCFQILWYQHVVGTWKRVISGRLKKTLPCIVGSLSHTYTTYLLLCAYPASSHRHWNFLSLLLHWESTALNFSLLISWISIQNLWPIVSLLSSATPKIQVITFLGTKPL